MSQKLVQRLLDSEDDFEAPEAFLRRQTFPESVRRQIIADMSAIGDWEHVHLMEGAFPGVWLLEWHKIGEFTNDRKYDPYVEKAERDAKAVVSKYVEFSVSEDGGFYVGGTDSDFLFYFSPIRFK